MRRVIGIIAAGSFLAIIHSGQLAVAAALLLIVGGAGVGAWKLWQLHVLLRDTDFGPALAAEAAAELDDECELATFCALQRCADYLDLAGRMLDDAGASRTPLDAARSRRVLNRRVDAFVFSGDGLGDLAAAWALEESCRDFAESAAGQWRRPAA